MPKRKICLVLALMMILSACGQANDAEITETTVSVSQSEEVTEETAVTTEVETTAAQETTATAETEPKIPLTPLEQLYKYRDNRNGCLLYDLTGDDFPEKFEIWEAMMCSEYTVKDIDDNIFFSVLGNLRDGKMYVCSDSGNPYILFLNYYYVTACVWTAEAVRIDISDNLVDEKQLGYKEVYYDYSGLNYNSECYFEGSDISPIGFYTDDDIPIGNAFEEAFDEYLSGCEVIDEITFGFDENYDYLVECTSHDLDFADYPNDHLLFSECDLTAEDRGDYYNGAVHLSEDGKCLSLYMEQLPEDFDFECLKEFDNIKLLWIHGDIIDDLEFVKYLPDTEILAPDFAVSSKEVLYPLGELPKLAVIRDRNFDPMLGRSGYGYNIDEWNGIAHEIFGDRPYLWAYIK